MPFPSQQAPIRPSPITYSRLDFVSTGEEGGGRVCTGYRLLADEEHVYGAEVKVVVKRKRGEAIVGWVLTSIELEWAQND